MGKTFFAFVVVTLQNPNPRTWQTPCTCERISRMHKAQNLSNSCLTIQ
ncbi:hypothetical protein SLEP1_g22582 [Rubroshorea leprosula]|uniref:Uncharacterized protein n=1 Tax=Rubroshorea leprosula TaxID=152421 RepID=A0AAV5J9N1_9ROSI|nr:hypothetical protein SLEP1_g22582 [Rubroshorea leprosula]